MEQMGPKRGTATRKKALPMPKAGKRVEAWKKILAILEEVKIDPNKLKEMENVLNQITSKIQILIDTEEFSDLFPLYYQRTLATKLQRTSEELRRMIEELEQSEKNVQSFCKGG
jgi:benzoyl-CoA reductase/2-hydroxyglutaryl-CoA dehydratase subunit BcrC/BadD/HgdB